MVLNIVNIITLSKENQSFCEIGQHRWSQKARSFQKDLRMLTSESVWKDKQIKYS